MSRTRRRRRRSRLPKRLYVDDFIRVMKHVPIRTTVQCGVGFGSEIRRIVQTWPHMKLYGFEPVDGFIAYWKTHNYPGALYPFALWSEPRTLKFFYRSGLSEASTAFPHPSRRYREFDVPAITLDMAEHFVGDERPRVLWMDCEGSEAHIISGAKKFLETTDYALVEVADESPWPRPTTKQLTSLLENEGFVTYKCLSYDSGARNILFGR